MQAAPDDPDGRGARARRAGRRLRRRLPRMLRRRLAAVPLLARLEVLLLSALAALMLWVRFLPWPRVAPAGAPVAYLGTDAYYHLRHALYAAAHFPATLPYDLFTHYPAGTAPGQYGTLYDVAAAGIGLLLGGGEAGVALAGAVLPPVLGALTVVPVYLLARRLWGRLPAAVAALALALLPGVFLVRSVVGAFDHHVAEALLSTTFAWALVRAVHRAGGTVGADTRGDADPDDGLDADLDLWTVASEPGRLRPLLGPWALAALALAAYLAVWPAGVLFVAIAALALLLAAVHAHVCDVREGDPHQDRTPSRTPPHTPPRAPPRARARAIQWTGLAVLAGAGLALVPFVRTPGLSATDPSWLQPVAAVGAGLAVFAAVEVLAWSRRTGWPRWAAPTVLLAGVPVLLAAAALLVPGADAVLATGLRWTFGLGRGDALGTISEARSATLGYWFGQYGLLLAAAAAGLVAVARQALRRGDVGHVLLLVWALVVASAAWNQLRFNYYLAVVVALLTGALTAWLARRSGLQAAIRDRGPYHRLRDVGALLPGPPVPRGRRSTAAAADERPSQRTWRHLLPLAIIALLLVPGHVLPAAGNDPAWDRAGRLGPGDVRHWEEPLSWMRANTPPEPFTLTTPFAPGQAPPDGAYGVLAWWDYGHWITAIGRRVPVANPFQQGAPLAAAWLTNGTEADADALLEALGGRVRYVVIDDGTAAGKYAAVARWAGVPYGGDLDRFDLGEAGTYDLLVPGPTYEASMLHRLYGRDADGLGRHRLVHESPRVSLIGSVVDVGEGRVVAFNRVLDRMDAATARDRFGDLGFDAGGRGDPLDGDGDRWRYDHRLEATVKVFERVAGARIEGTAPAGARVTARLDLVAGTTGRSFAYDASTTADAQGRFGLRVPYATSEPVPVADGGTATTVRADGLYRVATDAGQVTTVVVPDRAVLAGGRVVVNLS